MKILQHYLLAAALVVVSSGIRAGETEQRFDIAAQDLGPALQKLAAQSGVSIFLCFRQCRRKKGSGS